MENPKQIIFETSHNETLQDTEAALHKADSLPHVTRQNIQALLRPTVYQFSKADLSCTSSLRLPLEKTRYNPAIRKELERAFADFEYDCHQLNQVTSGNALSALLYYFIEQEGVIRRLCLDQHKCKILAKKIQISYLNNPFHNAVHACTVLHSTIHLIRSSDFMKSIQDPFLRAIVYLSACVAASGHDMRHPAVTSQFLINTDNPIAIKYNDQSVLENFHLTQLLEALRAFDTNIYGNFSRNIQQFARSIIIAMVLATDLQKHNDILARFQKRSDLNNQERLVVTLQILLKCADISHSVADFKSHRMWAYSLQQEMFAQGDIEKCLSLPLSMFADRHEPSTTIMHNQTGFHRLIVLPLFQALVDEFPCFQFLLDRAQVNYQKWKENRHEDFRCPHHGSSGNV